MELQVTGLSANHPDGTPALRDVAFTLPLGVHGLLGAAGAGKSTLLRVLAGTQAPARNAFARIDDTDLLAGADAARRCVGHLPQDYAPTCTAGAADVLNHYAVVKGIPGYQARRDIVEALLAQVGLQDAQRHPVRQLPEGMRQRFGLAVALLGRPPLLLLDAPLAGLAGDERAKLLALVAELGLHHVVLLATRDVADMVEACTQVVLLDRGELRLLAPLRPSAAGGVPHAGARTAAAPVAAWARR
jgi:ABC-type multidrug transport system ATPase subunit